MSLDQFVGVTVHTRIEWICPKCKMGNLDESRPSFDGQYLVLCKTCREEYTGYDQDVTSSL